MLYCIYVLLLVKAGMQIGFTLSFYFIILQIVYRIVYGVYYTDHIVVARTQTVSCQTEPSNLTQMSISTMNGYFLAHRRW